MEIERLQREPLASSRGGCPSRRGAAKMADDMRNSARLMRSRLERELGRGYRVSIAPGCRARRRHTRVGRERFGRERRRVRRSSARADRSRAAIGFVAARAVPAAPPRELDIAVALPDGAAVTFRTNRAAGGAAVAVAAAARARLRRARARRRSLCHGAHDHAAARRARDRSRRSRPRRAHAAARNAARASSARPRARSTRCRSVCIGISIAARACCLRCRTTCARR